MTGNSIKPYLLAKRQKRTTVHACECCTYPFSERHHLLPVADFGEMGDQFTCYLCPNCHALFHLIRNCAEPITRASHAKTEIEESLSIVTLTRVMTRIADGDAALGAAVALLAKWVVDATEAEESCAANTANEAMQRAHDAERAGDEDRFLREKIANCHYSALKHKAALRLCWLKPFTQYVQSIMEQTA